MNVHFHMAVSERSAWKFNVGLLYKTHFLVTDCIDEHGTTMDALEASFHSSRSV